MTHDEDKNRANLVGEAGDSVVKRCRLGGGIHIALDLLQTIHEHDAAVLVGFEALEQHLAVWLDQLASQQVGGGEGGKLRTSMPRSSVGHGDFMLPLLDADCRSQRRDSQLVPGLVKPLHVE